jgi:membrane-associated protease RseP (regulator of RpoE activity)
MGSPYHPAAPEIRFGDNSSPPAYVMPASPRPLPVRRHIVLFILTFVTTTLAGTFFYGSYASELGNASPSLSLTTLLLHGMWYSGSVLAILGAHEFGHYFACRYYGVDASLPYFLPFWLPVNAPLPGTLGAVIRIRQPLASKRQFFDIGIAGPIAGFLVLVPILVIGVSLSHIVTLPADFKGSEYGEPLLFRLVSQLFHGTPPPGQAINYHPAAWAAWFGLLATALNLFPIGQLDGGHISYAVLGPRSTVVTFVMLGVALVLTFFSASWIVWTGLLMVMLFMVGPRHPRVFDEEEPLDRARLVLALCAVVIFILCFTPAPIQPMELLRK